MIRVPLEPFLDGDNDAGGRMVVCRIQTLLLVAAMVVSSSCGDGSTPATPREPSLSFFVTSTGSGAAGGNLGGLAGADAKCQSLASAVGAGDRAWRAYLSTSAENARDRIGAGPWYNVNLELVAADVEGLHEAGLRRAPFGVAGDAAFDTAALDENGQPVPAIEHDIATGTLEDGTVAIGRTCRDWTSSSADDVAVVGHSDLPLAQFSPSWNGAHDSESCTEPGMAARLGSGRFYCFAAD